MYIDAARPCDARQTVYSITHIRDTRIPLSHVSCHMSCHVYPFFLLLFIPSFLPSFLPSYFSSYIVPVQICDLLVVLGADLSMVDHVGYTGRTLFDGVATSCE